jgi:hypothetical protein
MRTEMILHILSRVISLVIISLSFGYYGYKCDQEEIILSQKMNSSQLLEYIKDHNAMSWNKGIIMVFGVIVIVYAAVEISSFIIRYIIKKVIAV